MTTFTCAGCEKTYNRTNTVEEIQSEYEALYKEEMGTEETVSVCDTCYDKVLKWKEQGNV